MANMNIRSGDTVEIIVGNEENRGKRGKVTVVDPKNGKIVVEGLNLVTKHHKPRNAQEQGGRVQQPRKIDVSNVMVVCPKCGKATRVGHVLGEHGKYLRVCKQEGCGAMIDVKAEKKAIKTARKTARKKAEKTEK